MLQNKSIPVLINNLSNLVLAIENDENDDPLWRRFYQIQMAKFILEHTERKLILDEILQAYDSIYKTWDDLNSYCDNPTFSIRNLDNVFKSIPITSDSK